MEKEQDKRALYKMSRKIFVGNISYRVRSRRLGQFFSKFGGVESSYVVKDHLKKWSRGIGFVTFETEESMRRALEAADKELVYDSRQMRVKPAELSSRTTYWQDGDNEDDDDKDGDDSNARDIGATGHTPISCEDYQAMGTRSDVRMHGGEGWRNDVSPNGTHIDNLFDEILVRIFTLLSAKERIAIERVCWRWKHLVQRSWYNFRHLHVRNMFKGFNGLTDKNLNAILLRCGQYLEKIDLSASPRLLTDFTMDIIGKYCPQLTELDITSVKITDLSLRNLASKCTRLQHVRLKKSLYLTDKGVNHLCGGCQNLQYLDLSELHGLTGQHCFSHVGDSLRSVNLSQCYQLSDKAIECLSQRCRNLEEINLSKCRGLSNTSLEVMAKHLHRLQVLNIEESRASGQALQCLQELSNLEDLTVAFVQHVDDQTLTAIVRGCRKLRCVNMSGCNLTDAGVSSVACLPALTSLNISYMYSQVTQESIFRIAEVGLLRQFVARTSKCATDEAVVSLASFCPDLDLCDLSGCFQVTNRIFDGFREASQRDKEKTVDLYLGGTSVDWIADDVDWMSGFSHLNVSMNNLAMTELQPEQEILLPDAIHSDEEEEGEQYAPHPPLSDFQHDYLEEVDAWDEEEEHDFYLDNDDPLEAERWNLS